MQGDHYGEQILLTVHVDRTTLRNFQFGMNGHIVDGHAWLKSVYAFAMRTDIAKLGENLKHGSKRFRVNRAAELPRDLALQLWL